jgi:hypothetical protein
MGHPGGGPDKTKISRKTVLKDFMDMPRDIAVF